MEPICKLWGQSFFATKAILIAKVLPVSYYKQYVIILCALTDCYVGWPGSVHDARVFENSDLKARMEADPDVLFPRDTYLIGDAAYRLTTNMLTPYKDNGNLTDVQKRYNFVHASSRNVIERSFGILKARFPRLKFIDTKKIEDICAYVIAVCTIHNYAIDENDTSDTINFDIESEEEVNNFVIYGAAQKDAERKRKEIANLL